MAQAKQVLTESYDLGCALDLKGQNRETSYGELKTWQNPSPVKLGQEPRGSSVAGCLQLGLYSACEES